MSDDPSRQADLDALRQCIADAAAGSAEAVEKLLAAHHTRFLGFAKRKIGVDWSGRIDAEDLLQESYVSVFDHLDRFDARDAESFYRWVTQIIENRFFDKVRHWTRQKRDVSRESAPGPAHTSSDNYTALIEVCGGSGAGHAPGRVLQKDEAIGAMLSALAGLPADYRSVVEAVFLRHESYEQAATTLGRSPEAVRRMLTRAIDRLRDALGRASRFLSTLS